MVTSAVYAAAPHLDGMKKDSSWEGCALPNPPADGSRPGAAPHNARSNGPGAQASRLRRVSAGKLPTFPGERRTLAPDVCLDKRSPRCYAV